MKIIRKALLVYFLLSAFFGITLIFNSANSIVTAATEKRTITNIGIFVKFSDSDNIVPKLDDGTLIHLDDNESIANAEKLLNSGEPIKTKLYTHINSVNTLIEEKDIPSVKKYYETQSYGKLSIKTELFPKDKQQKIFSYEDEHKMSYYRPKSENYPDGYDDSNRAEREAELVNSAINYVSKQIEESGLNTNILDSNNDGKIDSVMLFIEGAEQRVGSGNAILWSHAKVNPSNVTAKILGQSIYAYSIISGAAYTESTGTFSLNDSGYGTIIHELGHIIGFADLYRINGLSSFRVPVSYYDIMGTTTDSNPQNFLAYFSARAGWHDPLRTISQTEKNITLSKPTFTNPSEPRAIKVQRYATDKEYFIIEYYEPHDKRDGYSGKDKGIIVYRINENTSTIGNYTSDTTGKSDHVFIFRPNESALGAADGDIAHTALNLNRPTLGKTLSDNKDFDNETIDYADGSNSGIIITVTKEESNSITFDVTFPEVVGDGSINNPYLISDTITFFYLMQNDTTGKYYKLTSDLDFKNLDYPRINLYGHLDGNNKTLSNIYVAGSGIFDNIGTPIQPSSVKNLKIENLTVTSSSSYSSIGGLASATNNTTLSNIKLISGSVTNTATSFVSTTVSTGGLIGNATNTAIDNCSSAVKVASSQNAGAFIGTQYSTDGTYNIPTNSTYDKSVNPDLPTVGVFNISNKTQTPPADLLQSIIAKTEPPEETNPEKPTEPDIPTPSQPEILPTETETLKQLSLTKKQQYLTGFAIGANIANLRQTISNLDKVQPLSFLSANGDSITSGEITTGMQLSIKIGTATYQYTTVIKGDVNGDGKIHATDYVKIRNHIMKKTKLTGAYLQAADINNDGNVHATDYVKVRNHIMKKTTIDQK